MLEKCLRLTAQHCGISAANLDELKSLISVEIANRKYGDDLRRARSLVDDVERGIKNEHAFAEVFARLYCATHSRVAWHHDWDAASELWRG